MSEEKKKRGRPRKNETEYHNTERIIENQNKFNETGDPKYLWEMRDDLYHAVLSLLLKQSRGYAYPGIYDLADDITLEWMYDFGRRRNAGKPFNMRSPISFAYYAILAHKPKSVDDTLVCQLYDDADEYIPGYSYEDEFYEEDGIEEDTEIVVRKQTLS